VKVAYAKQKGLGGLMIWELGGGYLANQPAGRRDLLLQSVKQALANVRRSTGLQ
jgi:GH18 family chitinase